MQTIQPSRKKAMFTQIIGSYLLTIISIVQNLFLLPLYFKYIDYELYGYWITIGSVLTLLSMVNFGVGVFTTQRISNAYAKKDYKGVVDYFTNSLIVYAFVVSTYLVLGAIIFYLFKHYETVANNNLYILQYAYYIALTTMSLSFFSDAFRGFTQSLLQPLFSIYSTIFSQIIGIVLIVWLLPEYKLLALPIGLFVAEFCVVLSNGIYSYLKYKQFNTKSTINMKILKEYKNHGKHLVGLKLSNEILNNAHPLIITSFLGAEMTTAYAVTKKALDVILTLMNIISSSLLSPLSNLVGEGDIIKVRETIAKVLVVILRVGLIVFSTYIYSNHMFVNLWIGKDIVLSQETIFLIGVSGFVFIMTRFSRSILFALDEIKFASKIVFFEGILYFFLATILVNFFGVVAIPFSVMVASGMALTLLMKKIFIINRYKIEKKEIARIIAMLFLVNMFVLFGNNLQFEMTWLHFIGKVIFGTSIIFVIELLFQYKNILKIS